MHHARDYTEASDRRLPDSVASLVGLSRGSGRVGLERNDPIPVDVAYLEGLGRGNG